MNIGLYTYIKEYFSNLNLRPLLVCTLLLGLLTAAMGHPFNQHKSVRNISLKLSSVSIHEGLLALEKKAGCVINYNKPIFKENQTVSIDVKDMELEQVLTKILAGTRVAFRMMDQHTVLLYKLPDPVKPGRVSGKIVDEKGESMPGASIKVVETGQGMQSGVDGSFTLTIEPGTYTLLISYMSYQTQRITGVFVKEGKSTPLAISLNPDSKGLKEVVVTVSYRKASVEGLLARQKNASEISNGISAEQISRSPDKNIGESLKRISGVSTVDNKFILVRGIGERYNAALLDGVVLPSTEAQSRNFSFDLIPSNMVDNVVVSKTVTPDMNASFGGGLIQVNTKDIPNEDFMSFSAGVSYNDQTTGKNFLSHKRGKYDYLGFDDGQRSYPKGLVHTDRITEPNIALSLTEYRKLVDDQSRRFTNDNFTIYKNPAMPSQNYQFSIGRLITLDSVKDNKLGFAGSLGYRNTQNINVIDQQTRGDWLVESPNTGAAYGFNTTWSALLNAGLQLGKNRFSLRNTYTHMYDNTLVRIAGYDNDGGSAEYEANRPPNRIREMDDPTFTDLLQNKLSAQHQLGKVNLDWDIARTSVNREEKDVVIATSGTVPFNGDLAYFYGYGNSSDPGVKPLSRHYYHNKEMHYSWNVSAKVPFNFADIRNNVKIGYFGNLKKANFDWEIAAFTADFSKLSDSLRYLSVAEMQNPKYIGEKGFFYSVSPLWLNAYEGKSDTHAGYVVLDNRFSEEFRLVWGIRTEYYKYKEIKNGNNSKLTGFTPKPDPHWRWLPSANLTYSPIASINIRAAFSSSVVRPELMENSQFWRNSPYLDALFGNKGLYSTRIDSYDFKTEWFGDLGELISIGGFYKHFDKPAELTLGPNFEYYLQSADWAKVYGMEFELRKNFGFISDVAVLKDFTIYGNLTLQKSDVKSTYRISNPEAGQPDIEATVKQKRAMYGQTPYLINAGLQYEGKYFGFNLMYNKTSYKTYTVSSNPMDIEYERARAQLDAQISCKLLKNKVTLRFNAGNLLNRASTFYLNTGSYEPNPNYVAGTGDVSNAFQLKPGFTDKYEQGDRVRFSQKFGRTYSTSIIYNF